MAGATEKRENWGSKIGLILAMAGNAIGLGNFWRYPYQAAKNGGGAFMLPYFGALILLGLPLMLVEWSMGRMGGKYGHGTMAPMVYLMAREGVSPRFAAILGGVAGGLALGVTVILNSYYNHIIGWTIGYTVNTMNGAYMDPGIDTGGFFVNYIQSPTSLIYWVAALVILFLAVSGGIQQGIERMAKILMPTIYVFGVVLIVKTLTLGAPINPDWTPIAGLNFVWTPQWDTVFSSNFGTVAGAAMGQIFFTLSLGMGIINNYASYLKPEDDVVLSGFATVSLNELAEVVLGGTIAIPIAYTFAGPEGLSAGVGLSFIALPNIFKVMTGGQIFGSFWFLLLAFAGITSAVAMYNYICALLMEGSGMTRLKASMIVFGAYILFGLPVGLEPILTKTADLAYLTEADNWVGNYFLIIMGLLEVIVMGWIYGSRGLDEINKGGIWKIPKWFYQIFIQFMTPVLIIVFLGWFTKNYIDAGYFKIVPDFVSAPEQAGLVPWVQMARAVMAIVLIGGFVQGYGSIKKHFAEELAKNEVLVRK